MSTSPPRRSVRFSDDERGGWSSDRPRGGAAAPRPANVSVRCSVLRPSDTVRYSPASLLLLASPAAAEGDRFAERVLEHPGAVLSPARVRGLLAARLGEEEAERRAPELLDAAVARRLEAGEAAVVAIEGLDPAERERFVRIAARFRRPRHLILLEPARDQVGDEHRAALNDLRRRLDAGELGAEGFATALRLGGAAIGELKRVVFRPAPRDE